MRVSVIFTTYNSPDWLEKVLWGWATQTHKDFEIVVADDGSGPETRARIESLRVTLGLNLRHVWQEDDGFQKSRILNRAVAASQGDYLVFSDGDCVPRSDFLKVHVSLARPGRFLSGGYVKLPLVTSQAVTQEDVFSGQVFRPSWLRERGAGGVKLVAKLGLPSRMGRWADLVTTTRPSWNGHNASGWKADVVAVNGFDERMQYGGQDRELGERLENLGVRGLQVRYRAVCVHLDHPRGYAKMESILKNKAIRKETRDLARTWTDFGLIQAPRDLDEDPLGLSQS